MKIEDNRVQATFDIDEFDGLLTINIVSQLNKMPDNHSIGWIKQRLIGLINEINESQQ